MVLYFKMDSVEQLAHHLINVKSHVRQSMLRDFYRRQHMEVADLYTVNSPLTERERDNVSKMKDTGVRLKKKRKKSHLSGDAFEMHTNPHYSHKGVLDTDISKSDCIIQDKKIEEPPITEKGIKCENNTQPRKCLQFRNFEIAEPHTSSTLDQNDIFTHYKPMEQQTMKKEANSISDLLGDTSILDDLFSNPSLPQPTMLPVRTQCEPVTTKSKHRRKDFWDILNDENYESINRLTDLSVIEKVCEPSIVPSVAKKDTWNDFLWVNNENFVWKKNTTTNPEAPSSSKSSDQ